MTGSALYQRLKREYAEKKGERFFSLSLLWSCLCEKFALSPACSFSESECPQAEELLAAAGRLLSGYPLQYELGYWEFRGKDYRCRQGVLIPREDTALLCELCEKHLPPLGTLMDFCCGSGIVGISVLLNRPDATAYAADLSPHALSLTEENARLHGVLPRLQIRSLDLFSPATEALLQQEHFSLFAANPPYIPTAHLDGLAENVKNEPSLALDGGEDGLRFYRRILELSLRFPETLFACEIGYDQKAPLQALFAQADKRAEFYSDLCGNDRCFLLR